MPSGPKLPESRLKPLPGQLSVREARDAYLAENGFGVEAYGARWTEARLLGFDFKIPNTERHRWAIMLHDLHHAATGYGTDLFGEIEISAWECRRGMRPLGLYMSSIVLGLTVFGMLVAARRTWQAWCAGAGATSLFHHNTDYDEILSSSLGTLRAQLGLPESGLFRGPRMLRTGAPGMLAETSHSDDEAPNTAIVILVEVAVLLSGLAVYLLVSDTGSGRDDGYAFVVAIHLAILAAGCVVASVRLAARRRGKP